MTMRTGAHGPPLGLSVPVVFSCLARGAYAPGEDPSRCGSVPAAFSPAGREEPILGRHIVPLEPRTPLTSHAYSSPTWWVWHRNGSCHHDATFIRLRCRSAYRVGRRGTHHGALGYHGTRRYHLTAAPGRSKDTPRGQKRPIGDPSAALPEAHPTPGRFTPDTEAPPAFHTPHVRLAQPMVVAPLVQVSAVQELDVERGEDALIAVRPSPAGDDARGSAPAYVWANCHSAIFGEV